MFYVSLMLTAKQKPRVDSQKIKRRESEHTTMEKPSNHKGKQQEKKKAIKELHKGQ